MIHKRALLIFDFDGTIADTAAVVMEVGNEVLAEYGLEQVDPSRFEEMRGKSAPELIREFHVPLYKLPAMVTSVRKSLKQRMDQLKPIDGMLELISEFNELEQVDLAVLSSNSLENVEFFLKKHDIMDDFKFIYGDVGVFSKYIKIRRITRAEGKNATVVGIGDEVRDVEAAKIAKITSVSVDWGLSSRSKLKSSKADHVVSSTKQLRSVLKKLIG